jgi:hypothetical protein
MGNFSKSFRKELKRQGLYIGKLKNGVNVVGGYDKQGTILIVGAQEYKKGMSGRA